MLKPYLTRDRLFVCKGALHCTTLNAINGCLVSYCLVFVFMVNCDLVVCSTSSTSVDVSNLCETTTVQIQMASKLNRFLPAVQRWSGFTISCCCSWEDYGSFSNPNHPVSFLGPVFLTLAWLPKAGRFRKAGQFLMAGQFPHIFL